MSNSNWKLKLIHELQPYVHPFKEYRIHRPTDGKEYLKNAGFQNERYQCKKCSTHNNRNYSYAVQWRNNEAFVPYITIKDNFGLNTLKCITTRSVPYGFTVNDVLFWQIYCAHTEDEMIVMDIII